MKKTFRQKLNLFILHIFGWKVTGTPENLKYWETIKKAIVIEAPHTSIADWIWGYLTIRAIGKKPCILINKKFFFFPLGNILQAAGGVPVYKDNKHKNLYDSLLQKIDRSERLLVVITPEGTRKKVKRWHKGFYIIAQQSKLPLLLTALDFKKKHAILGPKFEVTENFNQDIKEIGKFYEGITACHPEKFAIPV